MKLRREDKKIFKLWLIGLGPLALLVLIYEAWRQGLLF